MHITTTLDQYRAKEQLFYLEYDKQRLPNNVGHVIVQDWIKASSHLNGSSSSSPVKGRRITPEVEATTSY